MRSHADRLQPSRRWSLFAILGVLAMLLALPTSVEAKGSLSKLEDEFENAIKKVTPATVVCIPDVDDPKKRFPYGSSGVIVSRKGLVLSDGDAGIYNNNPGRGKKPEIKHSDRIEVRLPDLKGKGFRAFKARVIKRNRDLDTSLLRIEKPPSGLRYVKMGDSDGLRVGDFAFAVGSSFGYAAEAPATLTAGVIASLLPKATIDGGKWRHIYTSAAVNLGVNGGPLVDTRGRLIATISSAVSIARTKEGDPERAYAYLGKAVPIARLKHFYADLPEAEEMFPKTDKLPSIPPESGALATVFHHTARRAYEGVVSLEITRKGQLSLVEPAGRAGLVKIPRYVGPVSGVLVSDDGWILTSLYNLANIATLVHTGWRKPPENARVKAGLEGIEKIRVHLPGGREVSARVVSRHDGLGVALLKADFSEVTTVAADGAACRALEPAAAKDLRAGRFVLAIGNPYGAKRLDDPLLTVGILSKQHAEDAPGPWAGQWQTDAGGTDANCGGAAVDLHGKLLGLMTIWSATQHGRNSGIGFVVPWTRIEPVLGELKRGRSFTRPRMGVGWKLDENKMPTLVLEEVSEGHAAAKAGLEAGDTVIRVDGAIVTSTDDVRRVLRRKWSGDRLLVKVSRAGEEKDFELTLGSWE